MEHRIIVQPLLAWERMYLPTPLLLLLPRDRERKIHCRAAASPEKDVHWAAGRERGVNPF